MQPGHAETLLASLPKGDTHMKLGLLAAAVAAAGLLIPVNAEACEQRGRERSKLVALALLTVVMLAPNGLLASWPTANGWVLAAVLAILAVASAVISVAIVIGAALDD
jgi:hypothetical protein